jgi:hypothetical protein
MASVPSGQTNSGLGNFTLCTWKRTWSEVSLPMTASNPEPHASVNSGLGRVCFHLPRISEVRVRVWKSSFPWAQGAPLS